jgi:hypothetical protein
VVACAWARAGSSPRCQQATTVEAAESSKIKPDVAATRAEQGG